MYKQDLALNNLQELIGHKTERNGYRLRKSNQQGVSSSLMSLFVFLFGVMPLEKVGSHLLPPATTDSVL